MEFSPFNTIVKLCLQGMAIEQDQPAEAAKLYHQAWTEATNDFEKYLAAYYIARQQQAITDRLQWYQTALQYATATGSIAAHSAFATLYTHIAHCYEEMNDAANASKYHQLATAAAGTPADPGPFYHGTRAHLHIGDQLTPGRESNYQQGLQMNHIYFTAMANGAGLAAALAKGEGPERVYIVTPTGSFENDPNVTDKKFPGNPTRSYRTAQPLQITGEVTDWAKQAETDIQKWREKLDNAKGEIIN